MNGTKATNPYIYIIFYVPFVVYVPKPLNHAVLQGGTLVYV